MTSHPDPSHWPTDPPTEPGWYWFAAFGDGGLYAPEVVQWRGDGTFGRAGSEEYWAVGYGGMPEVAGRWRSGAITP